jgi:Matrixin
VHLTRRLMRMFVATVVALGVLTLAADAAAFCRSTTCRSTGAKECETDADACPIDGAKLFWPTSCVGFAFNDQGTQALDPEETFAVLRKTFQAWTEVQCPDGGTASITFEERGPVSCHKSEYNKDGRNLNVVLFQDNDWKYRGIDATLAKTSVTYNDETGEIYDADIEINTANNEMTVTSPPKKVNFDLQSIITHEVGHFIGIAHSPDSAAVMNATYSEGSIGLRKLTPDDIKAVCAIYPPKSGLVCNPEPRGGFSDSCGNVEEKKGLCSVSSLPDSGSGGATASLAMMGLGALVLARRARRSTLGRRS